MNILIAAPHLTFPLKGGDDKLIWERSIILKEIFDLTIILGMNEVIILEKGKKNIFQKYSKFKKSKLQALFKTLISRSDYKYSKFITRDFLKEYSKILKKFNPKNILISYLQTAIALEKNQLLKKNINYICETHNDEWTWNKNNKLNFKLCYKNKKFTIYKNFYESAKCTLYNYISQSSFKWLTNNISKLPSEIKMICLSYRDYESLRIRLKNHNTYVITPSINKLVDIEDFRENQFFTEKKVFNLLFVGNLNMKMNVDSIIYFCKKFNPAIQKKFGRRIKLNIVGREPSKLIKEICKEKQFNLYSNISDISLLNLYQNSNLLIMPFPYNCGFKLKFIEAIENGIPILGTTCVDFSHEHKLPYSLFSNDENEWIKYLEILTFFSKEEYIKLRKTVQGYATNYSKEKIKNSFINILDV